MRRTSFSVVLRVESLETRDVPYAGKMIASAFPPLVQQVSVVPSVVGIPLDGTRLVRANRMISTFENSTTTLRYDYIENLNDGRGYTAGRVGFTTATGDALLVIERFTQRKPINGLAKYLPRLRELAATGSDSTEGLDNFPTMWKKGATGQLFRSIQNLVANELYYFPSVEHAKSLGIKKALTLVALYDTAIQHGNGDDPDGLPAIIQRTNEALGGSPKTGIDERVWLAKFLDVRQETLLNPANAETQEVWAASVDRVNVVRGFLQSGNLNFNGPLQFTVFGDTFKVS